MLMLEKPIEGLLEKGATFVSMETAARSFLERESGRAPSARGR